MVFGKLGQEADFARDVGHQDGRDHLSEDDLVDLGPGELGPIEQLLGGVARQGHRGDILERRPALREGRPQAGDDGSPPPGRDRQHIIVRA